MLQPAMAPELFSGQRLTHDIAPVAANTVRNLHPWWLNCPAWRAGSIIAVIDFFTFQNYMRGPTNFVVIQTFVTGVHPGSTDESLLLVSIRAVAGL
jgi:hypothetical protein